MIESVYLYSVRERGTLRNDAASMGVTEADIACVNFYNKHSKWYGDGLDVVRPMACRDLYCSHVNKLEYCDHAYIGDQTLETTVEGISFVPAGITKMIQLIGDDMPVLTEELVRAICSAMDAEDDKTITKSDYDFRVYSHDVDVQAFLSRNIGFKVFLVIW